MGTNYYWSEEFKQCSECQTILSDEGIHIGKSSAGWAFALHVYPEEGPLTFEEWFEKWTQPGTTIVDEYGEKIQPFEMHTIVAKRMWERRQPITETWLRENDAFIGPNSLAVPKRSVHPHPEATYAYHEGDFS